MYNHSTLETVQRNHIKPINAISFMPLMNVCKPLTTVSGTYLSLRSFLKRSPVLPGARINSAYQNFANQHSINAQHACGLLCLVFGFLFLQKHGNHRLASWSSLTCHHLDLFGATREATAVDTFIMCSLKPPHRYTLHINPNLVLISLRPVQVKWHWLTQRNGALFETAQSRRGVIYQHLIRRFKGEKQHRQPHITKKWHCRPARNLWNAQMIHVHFFHPFDQLWHGCIYGVTDALYVCSIFIGFIYLWHERLGAT